MNVEGARRKAELDQVTPPGRASELRSSGASRGAYEDPDAWLRQQLEHRARPPERPPTIEHSLAEKMPSARSRRADPRSETMLCLLGASSARSRYPGQRQFGITRQNPGRSVAIAMPVAKSTMPGTICWAHNSGCSGSGTAPSPPAICTLYQPRAVPST